jgi:hypothetical protein
LSANLKINNFIKEIIKKYNQKKDKKTKIDIAVMLGNDPDK